MNMDSIDELKAAHDSHIQKLSQIHAEALTDLHHQLQKSRKELERVTKERDELSGEIEGMKTEVEMLRGSFDLVQERLRRVLVDQDDLVKMVKLIDLSASREDNREFSANRGLSASVSTKPCAGFNTDNPTASTITNKNNSVINSRGQKEKYLNNPVKDIETNLKRKEQDSSTLAALQAIKYFKKLEASDPIHLCRLLEIPFCPDRSFSLSTSLLASITVHMASDSCAMKAFAEHPLYNILLNEIVELKQESNELCKLFVSGDKKRKERIAGISKLVNEKKANDKSILKWLIEIEEQNEIIVASTNQNILSSVLSKFGI